MNQSKCKACGNLIDIEPQLVQDAQNRCSKCLIRVGLAIAACSVCEDTGIRRIGTDPKLFKCDSCQKMGRVAKLNNNLGRTSENSPPTIQKSTVILNSQSQRYNPRPLVTHIFATPALFVPELQRSLPLPVPKWIQQRTRNGLIIESNEPLLSVTEIESNIGHNSSLKLSAAIPFVSLHIRRQTHSDPRLRKDYSCKFVAFDSNSLRFVFNTDLAIRRNQFYPHQRSTVSVLVIERSATDLFPTSAWEIELYKPKASTYGVRIKLFWSGHVEIINPTNLCRIDKHCPKSFLKKINEIMLEPDESSLGG